MMHIFKHIFNSHITIRRLGFIGLGVCENNMVDMSLNKRGNDDLFNKISNNILFCNGIMWLILKK